MLAHPTADLIPVRALKQVTYCRRLYYLEYVESVMPINEHVEDCLFQHRRNIVGHDYGVHHQTRPFRAFAADCHDQSAGMSGTSHVAGDHCHDGLWKICAQSVCLDNQCRRRLDVRKFESGNRTKTTSPRRKFI